MLFNGLPGDVSNVMRLMGNIPYRMAISCYFN